MKILIHASLDLIEYMLFAANYIVKNTCNSVLLPDLKRYQYIREELGDDKSFTAIKNRLTRQNMKLVEECDCLLILNNDHRGIKNYIGGNSFLEMVVAFYLHKPIYLMNDIPEGMSYTEEIKSLYPKIVYNLENFIDEISKINRSCFVDKIFSEF